MAEMSSSAKWLSFCVCTAICLTVGASRAVAQNMLVDPGFEAAPDPDGNVDASGGDVFGATGWTVFGGGTYTASSVSDGPIAHTGVQTFKISFNTANSLAASSNTP